MGVLGRFRRSFLGRFGSRSGFLPRGRRDAPPGCALAHSRLSFACRKKTQNQKQNNHNSSCARSRPRGSVSRFVPLCVCCGPLLSPRKPSKPSRSCSLSFFSPPVVAPPKKRQNQKKTKKNRRQARRLRPGRRRHGRRQEDRVVRLGLGPHQRADRHRRVRAAVVNTFFLSFEKSGGSGGSARGGALFFFLLSLFF
jgi:hypothetical protein